MKLMDALSACRISFVACLLYLFTEPTKLTLEYSSQGYPDFYLGDLNTFVCSLFPGRIDTPESLVYVLNNPKAGLTGCIADETNVFHGTTPPYLNNNDGISSTSISDEYCRGHGSILLNWTITINLSFTNTDVRGKLYCLSNATYFISPTRTIYEYVNISTIKGK